MTLVRDASISDQDVDRTEMFPGVENTCADGIFVRNVTLHEKKICVRRSMYGAKIVGCNLATLIFQVSESRGIERTEKQSTQELGDRLSPYPTSSSSDKHVEAFQS